MRCTEPVPSGLEGAIVYIVDFCYPLHDLIELTAVAAEVHVLDHHKGQDKTIADYNRWAAAVELDTQKYNAIFDATRSGAKLTWETLLPEYPTPLIIEHISDRDLWLFERDNTKVVMAGLGSYKLSLEVWDRLFRWTPDYDPEDSGSPHQAAVDSFESDGYVVLRKMEIDIERITALTKRTIEMCGYSVPLVNMPRTISSEALEKLASDQPFAVGYFDSEHYREFSLRAAHGGADVLSIAKTFPGGGGHLRASGFRVGRDHPLAQI